MKRHIKWRPEDFVRSLKIKKKNTKQWSKHKREKREENKQQKRKKTKKKDQIQAILKFQFMDRYMALLGWFCKKEP